MMTPSQSLSRERRETLENDAMVSRQREDAVAIIDANYLGLLTEVTLILSCMHGFLFPGGGGGGVGASVAN